MINTILTISGAQVLKKETLKQVNADFWIEKEPNFGCIGNENNNSSCPHIC